MATSDGSCAVCLAVAKDPRQVPCGNGHVFCLSCLQGLIAHGKNVNAKSFPCPCCRNRVRIPRGGVTAFPLVDGSGSPDSAQPSDKQDSKAPSSARPRYPDGRSRSRPVPPSFAQIPFPAPLHLLGPEAFPGFPRGPYLPRPGPPRRMNGPPFGPFAYPHGFDMGIPVSRRNGKEHAQPGLVLPLSPPITPPFPKKHFKRQRSLSTSDQPVVSPTSRSPSKQNTAEDELAQASKESEEKAPEGAQGPPVEAAKSSEDLDMAEVLLVIAQLEQEQQQALAQRQLEQDEMIQMQIQMNEEEDMLEATSQS